MLTACRSSSSQPVLVACSQGIPFFHAGDDLLRSKSLDRDAYNSGDWFNAIDWTGEDNGFGRGLPVASKNAPTWPLKRPLLAQTERYKPRPEVIAASAEWFKALLRVRCVAGGVSACIVLAKCLLWVCLASPIARVHSACRPKYS